MTESSPPTPTTDDPPREGERIAKLLARAGVASRREVERMIAEGRIKINDVLVTTPATLLTTLHGLTVDGKQVKAPEAARLFAFHKPAGLLTAERDPQGRATIYAALRNALPDAPRLMPVGRLDLNTEGLLLLTNDGELKRAMELPASGIPRTYRARTYGEVSQEQLESLMEGIEVDGVHYGQIDANMERRTGRNQWIELTLKEGKNREVRRVLEALGLEVSRLLRTKYGPFSLGELARGQAYEISPKDVEKFTATLPTLPKQAPHPTTARAAERASRPIPAGGTKRPRKPDPSRPVDKDAPRSPQRRPGPPPSDKPGYGGRSGGRAGGRSDGKPGGRPDGNPGDKRGPRR